MAGPAHGPNTTPVQDPDNSTSLSFDRRMSAPETRGGARGTANAAGLASAQPRFLHTPRLGKTTLRQTTGTRPRPPPAYWSRGLLPLLLRPPPPLPRLLASPRPPSPATPPRPPR